MFIREEVQRFAEMMEAKLRENDYKEKFGDWHEESQTYLYQRIVEEVKELGNAENDKDQMAECVDVANFAMMIVCTIIKDITEKARGD